MSTRAEVRILIVDDDEDDAFFTRRMLQKADGDHRIEWVETAAEAGQFLAAQPVDVALVDYRLSGESGLDVIRNARDAGVATPMIVLTGQGDHRVDVEATQAGAVDYLVKTGLDSETLERAIRYAIERGRSQGILARMGRIMDAAANEIFVFAADSLAIVQSNASARRNLGYGVEELAALTPLEVMHELQQDELEARVEEARSSEVTGCRFQTRFRRSDGSSYPVEVQLQHLASESPPVLLATATDMTEQLSAQRQIQQARKMEAVGQLAGGLAHDFNNLLTVICGNLEMIDALDPEPQERRELIGEAAAAARRGADITHRLLSFSRRQPLEPVPTDLAGVVRDMSALLARSLGGTVRIETLLPEHLPAVILDPAQFENAVLNLAINARDAMPGGGLLRIEVEETTAGPSPAALMLEVRVVDTGEGMDGAVLEKVFEPFFTTKPSGRGSGVGLSMVYGFVTQSGGSIELDSIPGSGTTVRMRFPEARGVQPLRRKAVAQTDLPTGTERILVVEDDEAVRKLASRTLQSLGYAVCEARSGDEAVGLLDEKPAPDCLFTDLQMPGNLTGNELVLEARRRFPEMPIIVTSGYSERHEYKALNKVAFVAKPYSTAQLARLVRQGLDTDPTLALPMS